VVVVVIVCGDQQLLKGCEVLVGGLLVSWVHACVHVAEAVWRSLAHVVVWGSELGVQQATEGWLKTWQGLSDD
jgi:hypothetical protein